LDKLSDPETRLWYAQKALELGMGKDMLAIQISSTLRGFVDFPLKYCIMAVNRRIRETAGQDIHHEP
jgi:hypothetical protein